MAGLYDILKKARLALLPAAASLLIVSASHAAPERDEGTVDSHLSLEDDHLSFTRGEKRLLFQDNVVTHKPARIFRAFIPKEGKDGSASEYYKVCVDGVEIIYSAWYARDGKYVIMDGDPGSDDTPAVAADGVADRLTLVMRFLPDILDYHRKPLAGEERLDYLQWMGSDGLLNTGQQMFGHFQMECQESRGVIPRGTVPPEIYCRPGDECK